MFNNSQQKNQNNLDDFSQRLGKNKFLPIGAVVIVVIIILISIYFAIPRFINKTGQEAINIKNSETVTSSNNTDDLDSLNVPQENNN